MESGLVRLGKEFYARPVLSMARGLLGRVFVRRGRSGYLSGRIVETEAYHEAGDESCHAHRGRTPRNEVMFQRPGMLYVYFTYGMHYCMNVVAEAEGTAAAVLIRAIEPIEGIDEMVENRNGRGRDDTREIASGPAKLCEAFGIDKSLNGADLISSDEVFIAEGPAVADDEIVATTRIGISKSRELPWRFYIRGNRFISRP